MGVRIAIQALPKVNVPLLHFTTVSKTGVRIAIQALPKLIVPLLHFTTVSKTGVRIVIGSLDVGIFTPLCKQG